MAVFSVTEVASIAEIVEPLGNGVYADFFLAGFDGVVEPVEVAAVVWVGVVGVLRWAEAWG